jgi:broad specificity phosphatase PhoE
MSRILTIILLLTIAFTACKTKELIKPRQIYLVRHAEKMKDVDNPPLSPEGVARAQSLSEVLRPEQIDGVHSTAYKRTEETAQPTADRLGLTIQSYDPRQLEQFANTIRTSLDGNLLVVGHSNTTPVLVNHLLGKDRYPQLDESQYGDLFVVSLYPDSTTVELRRF